MSGEAAEPGTVQGGERVEVRGGPDPRAEGTERPPGAPKAASGPGARRRSGARLLLSLVAGALALVGGVAGLELYLRVRFAGSLPDPGCYVFDLQLGKRLKPGYRGESYGVPVSINALGLRDRELTRERPPGARRVLALGDSWTFGVCVAQEQAWPKQLERELGGPAVVEVVNAGVSGYETHHEADLYRDGLADRLEHDLVLVGFYPPNDAHDKLRRYRRYQRLHAIHPWLLDIYLAPKRLMITQHYSNWRRGRRLRAWLESYHPERRGGAEATDDAWTEVYRDDDPGWRLCKESLRTIGEEARRRGALGVVVLLPDVQDLERYVTRSHPRIEPFVRRAVEEAGLELIDLVDAFRPYARRELELVTAWGATHVDGRGYALIAREVAAALRRRGLLRAHDAAPADDECARPEK